MNRSCQAGSERGAAIVDFVLVGVLSTALFLGVVQLAVVVHVRNTLIDCAAEGARFAALADRGVADGVERTRALISQDLSAGYARDVVADLERAEGMDTVVIRVRAPVPVFGLFGIGRVLVVAAHAPLER